MNNIEIINALADALENAKMVGVVMSGNVWPEMSDGEVLTDDSHMFGISGFLADAGDTGRQLAGAGEYLAKAEAAVEMTNTENMFDPEAGRHDGLWRLRREVSDLVFDARRRYDYFIDNAPAIIVKDDGACILRRNPAAAMAAAMEASWKVAVNIVMLDKNAWKSFVVRQGRVVDEPVSAAVNEVLINLSKPS